MSGSLSLSVNRGTSRMDNATDMLLQYTQASILDDLLPANTQQSLLSQEMEVEQARNGIGLRGVSRLDATTIGVPALQSVTQSMTQPMVQPMVQPEDTWDGAMDFDLDPISGGDTRLDEPVGGQLLLKPVEKVTRPRSRKRRPIPLDKCTSGVNV